MTSPVLLELPGGRRLEVLVTGPGDGLPLLFHNGTPSGAMQTAKVARAAHERGLRLVSWSRPGYGDSTRQPGRRVVEVVPDSEAVLDWLGATRCLVAGWSGGGPHALACAARLGRAAATLVIAGVGPADAAGLDFLAGMGSDNLTEFGAAFGGERELAPLLEEMAAGLRGLDPAVIVAELASILPAVDQAMLSDEYGKEFAAQLDAALRTGVEGWLDDDLAFVAPWGFSLEEIAQPVLVWQGSEDLMVPSAHGEFLAGAIQNAAAHLEPGEGHLSIGLGRIEAMLDELLEVAR